MAFSRRTVPGLESLSRSILWGFTVFHEHSKEFKEFKRCFRAVMSLRKFRRVSVHFNEFQWIF